MNAKTVNQIIADLQALVAAEPLVGELLTQSEGCDCIGDCDGVEVCEPGQAARYVLFKRNDK